ncbi:zinc ribbon domain-containing protein YjdM [Janibacter terrae]|uniref:zinc ribbon domain-containing protein YjdM n=1 Tax=Janibacter terrae TaxID=103817 RepID=UPI000837F198|nr:zinc ribbon domain-containing protein YjdM [Janibacter terrae]
MSDQLPACPECASEFTYASGALLTCPMCGHEWSPDDAPTPGPDAAEPVTKDAVGNVLVDGDSVTVVRGLKVKGSGGGVLKIGTKVRSIRIIPDRGDGHDLEAKVAPFGEILLKSSVVKKAD